MPKLPAVLVSCLALGLVAAGCGSSNDNKDNGGGAASAPTSTPEKKQPANVGGTASKAAKVSMKNIQYTPASVTVKAGGTVTWTNDEPLNHDVTKQSGPGKDFKSGTGNLVQGDTYKQTFTTPGTVDYICTTHPGMKGQVIVK
jgi:amicyanin